MINVPAASGFIPQESVIDGIAKLWNTFSPMARQQQQAQLGLTNAQAGSLNASAADTRAATGERPEKMAQGWTGLANDRGRVKVEEDRLPIMTRGLDLEEERNKDQNALALAKLEQDAKARNDELSFEHEKLAQGGSQFDKSYQLNLQGLGLEAAKTGAAIQHGERADQTEADRVKNEQEHSKILKMDLAEKLWSMMPPGDPKREPIVYSILREIDPPSADSMLQSFKAQEAARLKTQQGATTKPLPEGGLIPGLFNSLQFSGGAMIPNH